jgi:hypothetical protein
LYANSFFAIFTTVTVALSTLHPAFWLDALLLCVLQSGLVHQLTITRMAFLLIRSPSSIRKNPEAHSTATVFIPHPLSHSSAGREKWAAFRQLLL